MCFWLVRNQSSTTIPPEHAACRAVGLLIHDVVDESAESGLARFWFAPANDDGALDVPGGQVLQDSGTLVLVLDAHGLVRSDGQGGMQSAADLNAGLLIGAQDVFVGPQRPTLPLAGVQVEHRTGPLQKVWITRKDPGPIPPGTQGVMRQPAPDGRA